MGANAIVETQVRRGNAAALRRDLRFGLALGRLLSLQRTPGLGGLVRGSLHLRLGFVERTQQLHLGDLLEREAPLQLLQLARQLGELSRTVDRAGVQLLLVRSGPRSLGALLKLCVAKPPAKVVAPSLRHGQVGAAVADRGIAFQDLSQAMHIVTDLLQEALGLVEVGEYRCGIICHGVPYDTRVYDCRWWQTSSR